MQVWAAAEGNLHAYLAKDGARTVFPTRSHTDMFFTLLGFIAKKTDEISAALAVAKGKSPPRPVVGSDNRV
jgi:hypothetical protein